MQKDIISPEEMERTYAEAAELIDFTTPEPKGRSVNNKAFLLSDQTAKMLEAAAHAITESALEISASSLKGKEEIQQSFYQKSIEALSRAKISTAQLQQIIDQYNTKKIWTLEGMGITPPDGEGRRGIVFQVKGERIPNLYEHLITPGQGVINTRDHRAIFEEQDYTKRAKMLGIPGKAYFISFSEKGNLEFIAQILNDLIAEQSRALARDLELSPVFTTITSAFSRAILGLPRNAKIARVTERGAGIIEGTNYELTIKRFAALYENSDKAKQQIEISPRTKKLFTRLVQALAEQNQYKTSFKEIRRDIKISLDDYFELTNTPNTKQARHRAKLLIDKDIDLIDSFEFSGKDGGRIPLSGEQPNDDGTTTSRRGVINGYIHFVFSLAASSHFMHSPMTKRPRKMFQISNEKPRVFNICEGLSDHYFMDTNRERENDTHDIISIKTLTGPYYANTPSYDQVKNGNRDFRRLIIKPIVDSLNELADMQIITWEFCNTKKAPLTPAQKAKIDKNNMPDYDTFIKLYIKFDIIDAPDDTERRERKQARLAKAKEAKERKEKKGKTAQR